MRQCSAVDEQVLEKQIAKLPEQMQDVVKHILMYGKVDSKNGMRYTKRYILECLLLSIKSRKGYLHLRSHNILPLPTPSTLRKYLKNMKAQYGFDLSVFKMLKLKSENMKPEERRGDFICNIMV